MTYTKQDPSRLDPYNISSGFDSRKVIGVSCIRFCRNVGRGALKRSVTTRTAKKKTK